MPAAHHRYLDLLGGWPGSSGENVELSPDGVRLAAVPGDATTLAAAGEALAAAAGIGVAPDGTIYVADREGHRILVIACDGASSTFGCLQGPGPAVGQLQGPTGVLVGPCDSVYVADTGNGRVVVADRAAGVVRMIWRGFAAPADLAADAAGRVLVADSAADPARRLRRFDERGDEDAAFGQAVANGGAALLAPRAVAILGDDAERLLVVDTIAGGGCRLVVLNDDGALDGAATGLLADVVSHDVGAVAVHDDTILLGTPIGVLAVGRDGGVRGLLEATQRSVGGIAVDCAGRVIVAGADGVASLGAGRRAHAGRLVVGPVALVDGIPRWDRITLGLGSPLDAAAHVRLWTRTGDAAVPAPPSGPASEWEDRARTPAGTWRAAPRDAVDALVLNEPAPFLWLCVDLAGDGAATPWVSWLRVEYVGVGLLDDLPAIYGRADHDETLWRLLALCAEPLDELDDAVADLPRLLAADAVPDRPESAWLDALAAWVAMALEQSWDEATRRTLVGEAFTRHGLRGTIAALEDTLGRAAGAAVRIVEPAAGVALWQLGESSVLGDTTMLTAAEADGAIVGVGATVDRAYLTREQDAGFALFADVAHRFCVHVDGALTPERSAALGAALQREKPAHTLAHICVLAPRTTVGFQARIGVDMVVAAPPDPLRLGDELQGDRPLAGAPVPTIGGRVGATTRVGRTPVHGGPHS